MFCHPALNVAAQLNIPSYSFLPSPAACLATFLYFPTLHRINPTSFKDLQDTLLDLPGLPPFPAYAMPLPVLDRNDEAYNSTLHFSVFWLGNILDRFKKMMTELKAEGFGCEHRVANGLR
ncbi:hypothetical protein MRB53_030098 [Persea americana]|uniref:Uncharacterized protein n=1 Tax=Persea americana TaxID=3435 RepID=A0ACC2KKR7_PERAE|nr:hypothetical protein MRB53_030098 [Persea americana]